MLLALDRGQTFQAGADVALEAAATQLQSVVAQALHVHVAAFRALVILNVPACIHSASDLHQDGVLRVYALSFVPLRHVFHALAKFCF